MLYVAFELLVSKYYIWMCVCTQVSRVAYIMFRLTNIVMPIQHSVHYKAGEGMLHQPHDLILMYSYSMY